MVMMLRNGASTAWLLKRLTIMKQLAERELVITNSEDTGDNLTA